MNDFYIQKIRVDERCDKRIRKILHPGDYEFVHDRILDLYGGGITVSAIVGKNGSGKSTLIELFLRMVNNLGAIILQDTKLPAAAQLKYVLGIYADLYFVHNNTPCVLLLRNEEMGLVYGNKRSRFLVSTKRSDEDLANFPLISNFSTTRIKDIASKFFYTIVTNYSLQSYISSDFHDEIHRRKSLNKWVYVGGHAWIDSLFNKNDGYLCPVCLNPYRNNGSINMVNEELFTKNRLSALLIEFQRTGVTYLPGYQMNRLEYGVDDRKIKEYVSKCIPKKDNSDRGEISIAEAQRLFRVACLTPGSFAHTVIQSLELPAANELDDLLVYDVRFYLVYKVHQISWKYPSFRQYIRASEACVYSSEGLSYMISNAVLKLTEAIQNDKSHITTKIWQSIHFLQNCERIKDWSFFRRKFVYSDYEKLLGDTGIDMAVSERMLVLPPPIFRFEIILTRVSDGENERRNLRLSQLSSGERQFLYSTSAVLYHLYNLRSFQKDKKRPKYGNVCIVFDETEICFHPEYQRQFLFRFIMLLQRCLLHLNFGIHIIVTTHSPFLLSDIDKGSILYLENGEVAQRSDGFINPLGANINDVLMQGFFLKENGFVGEYAKFVINDLAHFLRKNENKNLDWSIQSAASFINRLEEPFIKHQLLRLLAEYKIHYSKETRIDELERNIQQMQKELNELKMQGYAKNID